MDDKDAIDLLVKYVKEIASNIVADATYDKSYIGHITEVLKNNKYKILINGQTYTIKSSGDYDIGDTCYILSIQGNMNNLIVLNTESITSNQSDSTSSSIYIADILDVSVKASEINMLSGVTSNVQTQLDTKLESVTSITNTELESILT